MAATYDTKAELLDLMKQDGNKLCADCKAPMPQWASTSFGSFICLNCSGQHRGLGVHISFVRSLTMDKWTPEQLQKMRLGGNAKCIAFFEEHGPAEYKNGAPGVSISEKYQSHVAMMYRDKLLADCEGRTWSPSDTPVPSQPATTSPTLTNSNSSLRKPRGSGFPSRTSSPAPTGFGSTSDRSASPSTLAANAVGGAANPYMSDKEKKDTYFRELGANNAARSDSLPPSQGGKYTGFGSEPYNPSEATSSKALPSIDDIKDDPMAALTRGWGFFSSTLAQAGKTIHENVIQPAAQRAADPELQSSLYSYASKAGTVLTDVGRKGGELVADGMRGGGDLLNKNLGVDVGDMGASYLDRVAGRGTSYGGGYTQMGANDFRVPSESAQESGFGDSDDFFGSQGLGPGRTGGAAGGAAGFYKDEPTSQNLQDVWGDSSTAGKTGGGNAAAGSGADSGSGSGLVAKKRSATSASKKNDDWGDFGGSWKD